ncbi:MAG: GNAT family N-acetyltransferase, partial [Bacteroidota bacterium]
MVTIRNAQLQDIDQLHELILGLARHHHQEQFVQISRQALTEAIFGDPTQCGFILAEDQNRLVAYLSFTWNYSIW